MTSLQDCRALLLNADYTPVSVYPLSSINWQDALRGIFNGKLVAVSQYERSIRSARAVHQLPSVVALRQYQKVSRYPRFTRTNIWLRDGGRCVYCGTRLTTAELTFDHVMPRSRGGEANWENIVCACVACNCRKGNRTPDECGMTLRHAVRRPSQLDLARSARKLGQVGPAPVEWHDFLYWESELLR